MVTKEQAMNCTYFHFEHPTLCKLEPRGPRSKKPPKRRVEVWRKNGWCRTWKTRPDDFKLPIKHGIHDYSYITPENAQYFHTEEDCPLAKAEEVVKEVEHEDEKLKCRRCGQPLKYTGTMGAPGIGDSYECEGCGHAYVVVGENVYDPANMPPDEEPPWILGPEDVI